MTPQDRAKFDRMAAELAELRRDTRLIPVRWAAAPAATTYYLSCDQGNLLSTIATQNYYGLKRPAANVTTVPTVIPSLTPGATPDGLSPARLISATGSSTLVWAGVRLMPPSAVLQDDYRGVLTNQSPFLARVIVQLPLATDPTVLVPVYNVWRV
jgi:hypothetical protein